MQLALGRLLFVGGLRRRAGRKGGVAVEEVLGLPGLRQRQEGAATSADKLTCDSRERACWRSWAQLLEFGTAIRGEGRR